MNTEELRDALRADVDGEPAPTGWDRVQVRGAQIRRRRRGAQGAVALVSVVAIAAGAFAVTGTFSDGGGATRRGVVATPPGAAANEIVAQLADRVAVISAADGHVVQTLAEGIVANPGGVSVAPDGSSIVYTRQSSTTGCGTELVEQPLPTGRAHVIVGRAWNPLVSPDGRWLAYVINDNCTGSRPTGDVIGLTDLTTGQNYRPAENELAQHPAKLDLLAWSPGSDRLLYNEQREFGDGSGQKTFVLSGLPFATTSPPVPIPIAGQISAATYLPDGRLLTSAGPGQRYEVLVTDPVSGRALERRFVADGPSPSGLALDPSATRLLVTLPDGTLLEQEGNGDPRVIAHGVQSAEWLPASTHENTTSTVPVNVTVPDVVGLAQNAAQSTLTGLGFNVIVNEAAGPRTVSAGTVLTQSIVPGSVVAAGTVVTIVVKVAS